MSDPAEIAVKTGCATCAFDMGPAWLICTFPDPQDGTEPPFMAPASMPDRRNLGADCHHYRRAAINAKDTP